MSHVPPARRACECRVSSSPHHAGDGGHLERLGCVNGRSVRGWEWMEVKWTEHTSGLHHTTFLLCFIPVGVYFPVKFFHCIQEEKGRKSSHVESSRKLLIGWNRRRFGTGFGSRRLERSNGKMGVREVDRDIIISGAEVHFQCYRMFDRQNLCHFRLETFKTHFQLPIKKWMSSFIRSYSVLINAGSQLSS